MKTLFLIALLTLFTSSQSATSSTRSAPQTPRKHTFRDFERRAQNGEKLNVVFFGGSLTWGANSSDPQRFSYRALVSERLDDAYPRARFRFFDAAIGGTGSQLGVFRLERDVLRHNPDLVFLDFTLNDNPYSTDEDKLASYEAIVRRLTQRGVLVMSVRLPVQKDVIAPFPARPLDASHAKIAQFYGAGEADVVSAMHSLARNDATLADVWWPDAVDKTHPGDNGYAAYAESVWSAFRETVARNPQAVVPRATLHAPLYSSTRRVRLATLKLPDGWKIGRPNRTSAWFDALMSRWLDDEAVASEGAQNWEMSFRGRTVLGLGEATLISGKYRILIDGVAVPNADEPDGVFNASAKNFGGNMHHVRVWARDLDPTKTHKLQIETRLQSGQELRLESVCIAL